MVVTVLIGTSGGQYRDWRGRFYPQKLPQRLWLEHYAQHFATVESNNAFYRLPERATFEKWRGRTPPDFRWAVKASRFLTHIRRLREPEEPVTRLMSRAEGLGDRLDTILLQLPPTLKADVGLLRGRPAQFPPGARGPGAAAHRPPPLQGSPSSHGTRAGGPTRSARSWSATARHCAGPTGTRSRSLRSGGRRTGASCGSTPVPRAPGRATGPRPCSSGPTGWPPPGRRG